MHGRPSDDREARGGEQPDDSRDEQDGQSGEQRLASGIYVGSQKLETK